MDIKHVLIVDDDPHFRRLLKVILSQAGLKPAGVWEAESSHSAISICQSQPIDMIFCDLNLRMYQSTNGLEVIRALRGALPAIPIYMVTAENSETLIDLVCAAGATGHILKPINLRTLKRVVNESLALAREVLTPGDQAG